MTLLAAGGHVIGYSEVGILQPESKYVFSYADEIQSAKLFLQFNPYGLWAAKGDAGRILLVYS